MPKYWGKQIFSLGTFPEVGQKQSSDGNNNGQLHIANATSGGACKATWAKKLDENKGQLRFCPPPQVEHASRLDQKSQ